jgi:hypothetical protein
MSKMWKVTVIKLAVLSLLVMVAATAPRAALTRYAKLLEAIRQVESHGNPNLVGDNGKAIGSFQIWRTYWQDAVEHDKTIGGKYEDCKNDEYAKRIVLAYWDRYAPKNATNEQLARIHNGGPQGWKNSNTIKYWNKVKKELK